MNDPDVDPGEMNDDALPDLTDAEIEALFGHQSSAALDEALAGFVADARSAIGRIEPAQPTPALLEFIDVSAPPIPIRITTPETEVVELIEIDRTRLLYRSTTRRAISATAMLALIGGVFVSSVAGGPGLPGFGSGDESVVAIGSSTSAAAGDVAQDTPQGSTKADDFNAGAGAGSTSAQGGTESPSTDQPPSSSATSGQQSSGTVSTDSADDSTTGTQPSPATSSPATSSSTSSSSTTSSTTSSSTTSSSTTSSSSTSVPSTVANQSFSYSVSGVGSVTVSVVDGYVAFSEANPQPGWTVEEQHTDGVEAEIRFTDGEARVRLRAEVEDGLLRVTVRDDRNDDDQSDASFDGGQPVTGNTTQTTDYDGSDSADPDDPDSDDSDPDDPDSDSDNSGPGNANDPDDPDSDNSGPGNANDPEDPDSDSSDPDDPDDPDSDNSGSGNSGSGKSPDDSD